MESKERNHTAGEATIRAKATTQNILGGEPPPERVHPKWTRHFEDLTRLREKILAKKETLAEDVNVNSESRFMGEHLADAASDSYDRDWALSVLSSEQSALSEIEQALDRIARGN